MAAAMTSGPPLWFCHSTQKSFVALVGAMVGLSSRIRVSTRGAMRFTFSFS